MSKLVREMAQTASILLRNSPPSPLAQQANVYVVVTRRYLLRMQLAGMAQVAGSPIQVHVPLPLLLRGLTVTLALLVKALDELGVLRAEREAWRASRTIRRSSSGGGQSSGSKRHRRRVSAGGGSRLSATLTASAAASIAAAASTSEAEAESTDMPATSSSSGGQPAVQGPQRRRASFSSDERGSRSSSLRSEPRSQSGSLRGGDPQSRCV